MKEEKVLYQIKSLENIISRNFLRNNNDIECGIHIYKLTSTQVQIIDYVLDHIDEDIYQKDLEKVLRLRRATVSGVLKTMEKNNLIIRTTCKDDTRLKKILLNEKAKEVFLKNIENINKLEDIVTKNIDKNDLNIFLEIVNKMKNNIEEYNTKNE